MNPSLRNALLVTHRWTALVTGLFLAAIALTGCLISLEGPIDVALHPELWRVPAPPAGVAMLSPDSLAALTAAWLASGGGRDTVDAFTPPAGPLRPAVLGTDSGLQVFVNPYTGARLGTRTPAQFQALFGRQVRRLHEQLLTGEAGGFVVGLVTITALLVTLLGVVLWWKDKRWRILWTASWKRVNFDLHHTLGIVTAPVLVLMLASGVVIKYRALGDAIGTLDGRNGGTAGRRNVAGPAPQPGAPQSGATPVAAAAGPSDRPTARPSAPARTITLATMLRTAEATLPGAEVRSFAFPRDTAQPWMVGLRYPEDRTPGGRSRVGLDRHTGAVVMVRNTRTAGLGTKINNLKRSMHTGDVFGTPTDVIWFLASLVLATQAVSGAAMWWNGRKGGRNGGRTERRTAGG